jgi:glycosyltransferase involved in cell wall biosynthesis
MDQAELQPLFQNTHIFVLASLQYNLDQWNETQGVVLQEAQASGCLVIATEVGGVPECVNHGKDARLVRPRSSRAIFEAMCFYIDNPDKWSSYPDAGLENVKNNFSADVIGQKVATILHNIAGNNCTS